MLQLTPAETIMFQKNNNNEYFGNVEIVNISKKALTYKVRHRIYIFLQEFSCGHTICMKNSLVCFPLVAGTLYSIACIV